MPACNEVAGWAWDLQKKRDRSDRVVFQHCSLCERCWMNSRAGVWVCVCMCLWGATKTLVHCSTHHWSSVLWGFGLGTPVHTVTDTHSQSHTPTMAFHFVSSTLLLLSWVVFFTKHPILIHCNRYLSSISKVGWKDRTYHIWTHLVCSTIL